jgi:hypothetical protein
MEATLDVYGTAKIKPKGGESTAAFQVVQNAGDTDVVLIVNTQNPSVGVGTAAPKNSLHVYEGKEVIES